MMMVLNYDGAEENENRTDWSSLFSMVEVEVL